MARNKRRMRDNTPPINDSIELSSTVNVESMQAKVPEKKWTLSNTLTILGILVSALIAIGLYYANRSNTIDDNKPVLQLSHVKLDTLAPDFPIVISYKVNNSGKAPAKICKALLGYCIASIDVKEPWKYWQHVRLPTEHLTYIENGKPEPNRFLGEPLNETSYLIYSHGNLILYLFGEMEYQYEVANRKRLYRFAFQINPDGTYLSKLNENEYID
jgi:hypothetical protein